MLFHNGGSGDWSPPCTCTFPTWHPAKPRTGTPIFGSIDDFLVRTVFSLSERFTQGLWLQGLWHDHFCQHSERAWGFVRNVVESFQVTAPFFARTIHSTSQFAKTILSKCVTKLCVKQSSAWKMVCAEAAAEAGGAGYRIKKKNPTRRCAGKDRKWVYFFSFSSFDPGRVVFMSARTGLLAAFGVYSKFDALISECVPSGCFLVSLSFSPFLFFLYFLSFLQLPHFMFFCSPSGFFFFFVFFFSSCFLIDFSVFSCVFFFFLLLPWPQYKNKSPFYKKVAYHLWSSRGRLPKSHPDEPHDRYKVVLGSSSRCFSSLRWLAACSRGLVSSHVKRHVCKGAGLDLHASLVGLAKPHGVQ